MTQRRWLASAVAWLPVAVWIAAVAVVFWAWVGPSGPQSGAESMFLDLPDGSLAAAAASTAVMGLAAFATAVPLGVGAGLYLASRLRRGGWLRRSLELVADGLETAPPLIYGLAALEFGTLMATDSGRLGFGALAMGWILAPLALGATRRALSNADPCVHRSALALGISPRLALVSIVLPMVAPRIARAVLVGLARAIGDATPLLVLGAAAWTTASPRNLDAPLASLPVTAFHALTDRQAGFHSSAAAAMVALLGMALVLQLFAFAIARAPRWTR